LLHGPWDLPFVVLACLVEDPALEITDRILKNLWQNQPVELINVCRTFVTGWPRGRNSLSMA
jgi:hypothetical protein